MFGMRRYRIFLLVAALAAATIYYLTNRSAQDDVEYEDSRYGASMQGNIKPAVEDDPVNVDEPLTWSFPPPPESPKAFDSVVNIAVSSSYSGSLKSFDIQSTHTTSSRSTYPTVTGEDLLVQTGEEPADISDEGKGRLDIDWKPKDGSQPRWKKPEEHFPLEPDAIIDLPSGEAQKIPRIQATFKKETSTEKKDRISKLNTVKTSFMHAWTGYKNYGSPHDEVKPISRTFTDPFMGWGATLVDSLDTLWIMGFEDEFSNATQFVAKIDFKTSLRKDIPLFETVIRYMGGLLSAYDVSDSKYPALLDKAEELADILMGAFDTPNRMPQTFYNWAPSYTSQSHRAGSHVVMAELGSLSVEMTRLAQLTGDAKYYDAIARITDEFEKWQSKTLIPGLWPMKVDASGCKKVGRGATPTLDEASVPILADSASTYETEDESKPLPILAMKGEVEGANIKRRQVPQNDSRMLSPQRSRPPPLQYMDQEVLAVECTPQGLSPAPNGKAEIYGIGGQADSSYEYLPKMHLLLQGRTNQYERMYKASAKAIEETLLFRPMIKDTTREILFAAKHELNPKAGTAKKREIVTHEVTHLSCFIGGMFALGARLFGIEGHLEYAKQLTDGCVWAYSSMPVGIMAETASIVACPDLKACKWDQKRWHDALDPNLKERLEAVEQWNEKQKEIYESSKSVAVNEAARPEANAGNVKATEVEAKDNTKLVPRAPTDDEPSKVAFTPKVEQRNDDYDEYPTGPIAFVPKIALSHERYAAARIQEERLPPSYTKITDRHYGLRPEAIESVFYMWRITGDETWRQKGWQMFQAIQSATQTEIANAGIKDVTSHLGVLEDTMESFWLAETLKYFYLLFDEPEKWSLDQWVLNTEAHFLKIS